MPLVSTISRLIKFSVCESPVVVKAQ